MSNLPTAYTSKCVANDNKRALKHKVWSSWMNLMGINPVSVEYTFEDDTLAKKSPFQESQPHGCVPVTVVSHEQAREQSAETTLLSRISCKT
eukprot:3284141-Amphidinium_carterae.2